MSQTIPESHRDLLDKKAFGYIGTVMRDGSPQVTPVWFDPPSPIGMMHSFGTAAFDSAADVGRP